ncbi:hypothetical protein FA95DRAFT_1607563 [Auriscalpium vulgare]|uniref:Uncharacterized protein n=1 Tax=Auriscalpium vulgare TaxID=40419 RepID=A0ACB8RNA4_9AGAM|nr:hypothetical protein FA95DRAFT_1607563 [Auriscalpium vulgare]
MDYWEVRPARISDALSPPKAESHEDAAAFPSSFPSLPVRPASPTIRLDRPLARTLPPSPWPTACRFVHIVKCFRRFICLEGVWTAMSENLAVSSRSKPAVVVQDLHLSIAAAIFVKRPRLNTPSYPLVAAKHLRRSKRDTNCAGIDGVMFA